MQIKEQGLRILVVSNLYPPYYIGGYEVGCRDVVEALRARGHDVKVLTSTYGVGTPQHSEGIYRWLKANIGWNSESPQYRFNLLRQEMANQEAFRRLCRAFTPDVVYVWNLRYVSVSVAFTAQRIGFPVCYFVFDNWLSRWESDPWYSLWNSQPCRVISRLGKGLLRPLLSLSGLLPPSSSLDLRLAQFASQYLKQFALQAGKPVADAKVIHWGVDVNRYPYKKVSGNPKRLLYVGQIVRHKGVHTAVEALRVLVQQHGHESVTLTIVGGTTIPDYEAHVRRLVSSLGLENNVRFTGLVPHERLPSIYQDHDILVFPSVWDEPFGITLLEAMSSGLAVVGTATGGSQEILQHEINAMVFPKEDPQMCAMSILRLMEDHGLFETIRLNGRHMVEQKFRIERTVDMIEQALQEAALSKVVNRFGL